MNIIIKTIIASTSTKILFVIRIVFSFHCQMEHTKINFKSCTKTAQNNCYSHFLLLLLLPFIKCTFIRFLSFSTFLLLCVRHKFCICCTLIFQMHKSTLNVNGLPTAQYRIVKSTFLPSSSSLQRVFIFWIHVHCASVETYNYYHWTAIVFNLLVSKWF